MGVTPRSHSWQWGKARADLQVTAIAAAAPLLVLGIVAAILLGFSWRGLLWGLGLATLAAVAPVLVVLLSRRLSTGLADPTVAGPATTIMNLRAGVLVELARLGVVTLQDVPLRDAVWLGLGVQLFNVLSGLVLYAGRAIIRPSPLDLEQAAAGRSVSHSYGRRVLGFGRSTLVEVGLSLLLALSPWLAFITIPVGSVWEALIGRTRTTTPAR
ncbi:membrane protein implicated in regulation of membrane protease activity [Nonomuraea thailandensis]|uniref:Membrane protein implicated in regulation of membrane protease activity n=1 Tax=Nonomuraea thailandensis TaxID=1188745 RepID=A0A9X2K325_9ACTN|nr:hypothetical protein [Nonomuraea thailandensis]MCP2355166.1 membrane protein implicated in regulation of membrane protease activity [Nonomuraea thailandensis]